MGTILATVHQGIAAAVEQTAPKPMGLVPFFALAPASGTRYINLDKRFSKARSAGFVNPTAVADGTEKLAFTREPFLLPTIQDLQSVTGVDLEQLGIGEWDNATERSLDRFDNYVFKMHSDQRNMVDVKVGISAIEVAFDGQLTVLGKGENRVLDFGRPADLTIDTGGTDVTQYWDDAAAERETHLTDALEIMGSYGMTGDVMIGRNSTIKLFVRDAKILERLDNRRTELGGFVFDSMLATQGMVYYGDFDGVKIFGFDGNYTYTAEDGTLTNAKAVPANKVVIIASNNNNVLQPAVTPILTGGEVTIDGTEFMTVVTPNKRDVEVEAMQTIAPLEAGVGSFCTLQVLA